MKSRRDKNRARRQQQHHSYRSEKGKIIINDPLVNSHDQSLAWEQVVDGIQKLYPQPLPIGEAECAAKNLVTFYRTLLAIKRRTGQNRSYEQRR
jgi:hypothetical protein